MDETLALGIWAAALMRLRRLAQDSRRKGHLLKFGLFGGDDDVARAVTVAKTEG
jgi:hypothetical protein